MEFITFYSLAQAKISLPKEEADKLKEVIENLISDRRIVTCTCCKDDALSYGEALLARDMLEKGYLLALVVKGLSSITEQKRAVDETPDT